MESKSHKMNPLDTIIAKSVRDILEEDLGSRTYKKIEKEMNQTLGMSMIEATRDFSKLDLILRKFFGNNVVKMERRIFKRIVELDKKNNGSMIIIKDPKITKMVFESYGDPIKKTILEILLKEPKSIPQAIAELKLPQASTYRRAKELIKDGLVTIVGHAKASDGRKVNEYKTTFSRAKFDVQEKGLHVSVKLQNKFFKDSFALSIISGE